MAFDKGRPSDVRAHELHDRIEPLAVADLQEASPFLRESDQFPRFGDRYGNRLLHQHMLSGLKTGFREIEMHRGGSRNADRLYFLEQRVDPGLALHPVAIADQFGTGRVGIHHSHQSRSR